MIAKKIALGFGIAVVFPMLIHYGVSTFVHSPKWDEYQVQGVYDPSASPQEKTQRQSEHQQKQKEYRAAEKRFQQHLFVFAVPFGLVALLVGAYLSLPAIGTGLMFGGIFSICDGYSIIGQSLRTRSSLSHLSWPSLYSSFLAIEGLSEKKSNQAMQSYHGYAEVTSSSRGR
jgi:hypothetical protein